MDKHGRMECVKIYDKNDLMSLPSGVWGIKEPNAFWQGEPRLRGKVVPVSLSGGGFGADESGWGESS